MSDSVKFKKDFLNLVNDLTTINPSIIFEKNAEKSIMIKRTDPAVTVAYVLSASSDSFDFGKEPLAIYNYPEFYQLINVFEEPQMIVEENKIIICSKKSKVKYLVSDVESISKGPKEITFPEDYVSLKLNKDILKNVKKMIGLIKAEKVAFAIDDDVIIVRCFNDSHSNSWEDEFKLEKDSEKKFNIVISSKVFTLLPDYDYSLNIAKAGIVRFKYTNESVNLEVFVAEINSGNEKEDKNDE